MKNIKDIGWFIINLILIELGFISFVLLSLLTHVYGFSESRNSFLTLTGIILLILGAISMYFFSRDDKKNEISK